MKTATASPTRGARRKPQPRELYKLTLRDKPEGYSLGEIGDDLALTTRCKVCGGVGLRFLLSSGYVVLHEIRFVERLLSHGTAAWGSVVLDVQDACAQRRQRQHVKLTLKKGMGA